ncbi:alginate lyase family protein [Sphingomonas panacisoli]|uniref:Alginate lyase family protein n=1 Tax=Sphingomonas panacisoli TaxID=1813879 RepID=A0A5B8LIX9_9SPHN|nr:alginate lyase family protein [Sphingomonas panacisoli]QDZ07896.1 alginate lyase family protein [Sphingomonas panacisoli]
MRWTTALFASVAVVAPVQASAASDYAVLGPRFAAGKAGSDVGRAIIARAHAALTRPPGAIPRLHTEGTLPGKGIREISLVAKRDQPIVLDLAMAWRLTGDRAFLAQAGRYLDAWASIYEVSLNPIDETGFDTLMMAYDLSRADLPADQRARIDAFWRRMATGYLEAMDSPALGHANTNWQSHRVKLATMAAFETGDRALIDRARAAYRNQIAANLRADGSTFDFEERDALHYVTYDLEPLMMAALAANAHGEDWYSWAAPSGASLPKSLDWLAQFANGTRTHIEFANSKVQFDRDRAAAGQDEYAPHPWKPEAALDTFWTARLLDRRFAPLANTLAANAKRLPAAWLTLY